MPCGDWAVGNMPLHAAGHLLHITGRRHAGRQLLLALMCVRKEKTPAKWGISPDRTVLSISIGFQAAAPPVNASQPEGNGKIWLNLLLPVIA